MILNIGTFCVWLFLSSVIICIAADFADKIIRKGWLRMLFVLAMFIGAAIEYSIITWSSSLAILVWIALGIAYAVAIGWLFISKCHLRRYGYETWQ